MKGQSIIVQFVLFFTIGLSIFLGLGNLFSTQHSFILEEVLDNNLKLISSYVDSYIITMIENCKDCDLAEISFKLRNTTAGRYIRISGKNGIEVSALRSDKFILSSVHNLNSSYNFTGTSVSITSTVLTFNKTQNNLEVR